MTVLVEREMNCASFAMKETSVRVGLAIIVEAVEKAFQKKC